jgi:metal-responsive CopG/Arc/MetJ family transcriptional regulator
MPRVAIDLPEEIVRRIDEVVVARKYSSREAFILAALDRALPNEADAPQEQWDNFPEDGVAFQRRLRREWE